jgi:diacylglycerol kinase family enzyme
VSADQLDIDAIAARANAATPGPWEPDEVHMLTAPTQLDGFASPIERAATEAHLWANYLHIAGMDPDTTLALVAEVRRLRDERVVATLDELDLLPVGAVVLSSAGSIACRWDGDRTRGVVFGRMGTFLWKRLELPVTVLYRPEVTS